MSRILGGVLVAADARHLSRQVLCKIVLSLIPSYLRLWVSFPVWVTGLNNLLKVWSAQDSHLHVILDSAMASTQENAMNLKRLTSLLVCCTLCAGVFATEVLRFAASTSWNMPYAKFENERLTSGIVFELARAVEKELGMTLMFVALPRKRLDGAGLAGDYDLRCYLTPQWTEIPDKFVWSPKLFDITDVVFGTEAAPDPKTLAGIPQGAVIGAVLGYSYPTLEPFFVSGQFKREDAGGQENVMLKMNVGRTLYGVSDALALNWYQRTTPQHRLSKWRVGISRHDFQCAIPLNGSVPPGKILKALDDLKRSGRIEDILKNYR